jgi:hypothetical protein
MKAEDGNIIGFLFANLTLYFFWSKPYKFRPTKNHCFFMLRKLTHRSSLHKTPQVLIAPHVKISLNWLVNRALDSLTFSSRFLVHESSDLVQQCTHWQESLEDQR